MKRWTTGALLVALACTFGLLGGGIVMYLRPAEASRNSSGTYSVFAGTTPVVSLQTVGSSLWNNAWNDMAASMTDSLDRNGRGGMLAALRGVDGTVAAPAFAYTSEAGSGEYRIGAGDVGMAILGAKVGEWTSNGLRVANGAVATPSLSFFNDTGAGLYRAGSNDLRFAVNGADKTFWGTLGFGIGAAPATLLHVQGTIVAGKGQAYIKGIGDHGYLSLDSDTAAKEAGILFNKTGSLKWEVYSPASSNDLRFFDGTADRLILSNGGGVTIGASGTAVATLNVGTCTLNNASPSQCTATVASGAKCVATVVGTVTVPDSTMVSVTATTLTVTHSNAKTNVVNYVCF